MRQGRNPQPKTPARSRALYPLREFVIEPLLDGLAIMLLLGGAYLLSIFLCGGSIR